MDRLVLFDDIRQATARSDLDDSVLADRLRTLEVDFRKLRTSAQRKTAFIRATKPTYTLPTDFLTHYSLIPVDEDRRPLNCGPLNYIPQPVLDRNTQLNRENEYYYTLSGEQIIFGDTPTVDNPLYFRLTYYAAFAPLRDNESTNWLLTNYYNVYYYGMLTKVYEYLMYDDAMISNKQAYLEALNDLVATERTSNIPDVIRIAPEHPNVYY